jgi:hypothetical protein
MLGVARSASAALASCRVGAARPAVADRAGHGRGLCGARLERDAPDRRRARLGRSRERSRRKEQAEARWDLIVTTLFLHHFEGVAFKRLLAAIERRAVRFFACEPRRAPLALVGSHLVGALGANAVTREDAVLSVRAGFRDDELSRLWPGPPGDWRLREYTAGLFSHCLRAERRSARVAGEPADKRSRRPTTASAR